MIQCEIYRQIKNRRNEPVPRGGSCIQLKEVVKCDCTTILLHTFIKKGPLLCCGKAHTGQDMSYFTSKVCLIR